MIYSNSKCFCRAVVALSLIYGLFSVIFSGSKESAAATAERQKEQQFIAKDMTAEADEALSAKIALQAEIADLQTKTTIEIEAIKNELSGFSEQLDNLIYLLNNQPEPAPPAATASPPVPVGR
jgi:hypothetical protein